MFEPGQFVVCVNDSGQNSMRVPTPAERVERGRVYEVRWCGEYDHPYLGAWGLCVRLVGIVRLDGPNGRHDAPLSAHRFRPLPDSRLDIFRQQQEPVKETA